MFSCLPMPQSTLSIEPKLFWLLTVSGLILSALLLNQFFAVNGAVDHWFIQPWVASDGSFPYRENWWLTTIAHNWVKYFILGIVLIYIIQFVGSFFIHRWQNQRWVSAYVLLAMLCSSSLVGILKSMSEHACPWSLAQPSSDGIMWLSHTFSLGKCFPGGHSSAGFGLLALFFAYHLQAPKKAWLYLLAALVLGSGMGWTQMMRGAHFLSHNLWTLWFTWLVNVLLYFGYQRLMQYKHNRATSQRSAD